MRPSRQRRAIACRATAVVFPSAGDVPDGGPPAFKRIPLHSELVHGFGRKLYETRFDVYLRDGFVYRRYDGLAVGERLVRCRDDDYVRAWEAGCNGRLYLAAWILGRVGRVEEVGEFLGRRVVELEGARRHRNQLQVFHDSVDVVPDLNSESARAENRSHALEPGDVPERYGNATLEIRRVV